jgi:CheY-like chemotaxis protein
MAKRAIILLVEDDTHDVELMQLAFNRSQSPFSFVSVPHGAEAIKYLSREGKYADRDTYPEPFLVLLDLTMPVMNGFETLQWMQRQTTTTWPPVIVFSYSRVEKDVQLARQLGAISFLTKPVDLDSAVALLSGLEKYWPADSGPTTSSSNAPVAPDA